MLGMSKNREWLLRKAREEAANGCTSVGGLAYQVVAALPEVSPCQVLARLVNLRRRELRLSQEALARRAELELAQVVSIEEEPSPSLQVHTVRKIAGALGLPEQKLMQVAGLAANGDERLDEAAQRFAASVQRSGALTPEEKAALGDVVKVLVGPEPHEKAWPEHYRDRSRGRRAD